MAIDESGFRNATNIGRAMVNLATAHPNSVGLETLGVTHEGRPINALRIASKEGPEVCRLLILGGHHAREWIAVEVPYLIGERLVVGSPDTRTNAEIVELLRKMEIWVIPVVNPDGCDYSHLPDSAGGDRMWRKNRRPVGMDSAGRTIFGVDLNRNYDINFRGGGSTSGVLGTPNYPGEEAFSELETQAIRRLLQRFKFQYAVSYHSFSQEVLHPFGFANGACDANCLDRLDEASKLSTIVAQAMGDWHGAPYVAKSTLSKYPTSGDCADWLLGTQNTVAITVELPPRTYASSDEMFMLDSSEIMPIYEGAWKGVVAFVRSAACGTPIALQREFIKQGEETWDR